MTKELKIVAAKHIDQLTDSAHEGVGFCSEITIDRWPTKDFGACSIAFKMPYENLQDFAATPKDMFPDRVAMMSLSLNQAKQLKRKIDQCIKEYESGQFEEI